MRKNKYLPITTALNFIAIERVINSLIKRFMFFPKAILITKIGRSNEQPISQTFNRINK